MSLFCTVSETSQDMGRKSSIVTYFTSVWRRHWGVAVGVSTRFLASENLVSGLSYVTVYVIIG